jgi:hypothetical protein
MQIANYHGGWKSIPAPAHGERAAKRAGCARFSARESKLFWLVQRRYAMKTFFVISATIILAIPLVLLLTVSFPVVLSAILLVGIPLSIHNKKSHTTGMDLAVSGAHTLSVPELGLTMADGGEKVAASEARRADE